MTSYGPWVNLYPCKECNRLYESTCALYSPCPVCGGDIGFHITGRAVYQESVVEKRWLFGLLKYKVLLKQFIRWERRG